MGIIEASRRRLAHEVNGTDLYGLSDAGAAALWNCYRSSLAECYDPMSSPQSRRCIRSRVSNWRLTPRDSVNFMLTPAKFAHQPLTLPNRSGPSTGGDLVLAKERNDDCLLEMLVGIMLWSVKGTCPTYSLVYRIGLIRREPRRDLGRRDCQSPVGY
jgi:hypothetical protein